ncbi:hypothetical protein [Burkholderia pyrrocinia]
MSTSDFSDSGEVTMRTYLSMNYLTGAALLAKKEHALEAGHRFEDWPDRARRASRVRYRRDHDERGRGRSLCERAACRMPRSARSQSLRITWDKATLLARV